MRDGRIERDRGSAGVEAALAVTALLGVTWFVVGALRITTSGGDVGSAARAGARAAATARPGTADAAARAVVGAALADRGVACAGEPAVVVTRGLADVGRSAAAETVTVSVTCTVGLADVGPVFPGASRTVTGVATELVDHLRGDG